LIGDSGALLPEMLRTLKSISRDDFLILGRLAEMVSRGSGPRPIGASGTLLGDKPSMMEARRRRMEVSAGDLTDVDVAFLTEERRVALREDSTLSSSMLR
jgi:hypothetical protein